MALVKTVSKKSVKYVQKSLYHITFNLSVSDGAIEVINQDISVEYRTGDTPAQKVNEVTEKMQKLIDDYKAEQDIFNANALNTAVNNISGGLTL